MEDNKEQIQEQPQPAGTLFEIINYYSNDDLNKFIDLKTLECAHNKSTLPRRRKPSEKFIRK